MRPQLALLAALVACEGSTQVETATWPEGEFPVAFLASRDATGAVGIDGPFSLGAAFTEPVHISSSPESEHFLVALSEAAMRSAFHGITLEKLAEFSLGTDGEACLDGRIDLEAGRARFHPASESIFILNRGSGRFEAAADKALEQTREWVVQAPLKPEPCADESTPRLSPYAEATALLPPDSPVRVPGVPVKILDAIALDGNASSALVLTAPFVTVVKRGQPYELSDRNSLFVGTIEHGLVEPSFDSVAVAPAFDATGKRRALLLISSPSDLSAVAEIRITGDEIALTGVSFLPLDTEDIIIDKESRVVIGGKGGVSTSTSGKRFDFLRLPRVSEEDNIDPVLLTHSEEQPHALAARDLGSIFVGDAVSGSLREVALPTANIDAVGVWSSPGGLEFWVTDVLGRLFQRKASKQWEEVPITLTGRDLVCGGIADSCGLVPIAGRFQELVLDPASGRPFVAGDQCSAAFQVRADETIVCADSLPSDGPPESRPDEDGIRALAISERTLFVGGRDTELWVADLD